MAVLRILVLAFFDFIIMSTVNVFMHEQKKNLHADLYGEICITIIIDKTIAFAIMNINSSSIIIISISLLSSSSTSNSVIIICSIIVFLSKSLSTAPAKARQSYYKQSNGCSTFILFMIVPLFYIFNHTSIFSLVYLNFICNCLFFINSNSF